MRNIVTWVRGFILRHRFAYWTVSVLTLGHYHTYQCGWESGINFGMGD